MQVLTDMQLTPDTASCFAPVEQNLATAGLPVNVTVLNWTNPLPNATLYDMVRWHCFVCRSPWLPAHLSPMSAADHCRLLMLRYQPAGPSAVLDTHPVLSKYAPGCGVFCC